jgi:hypothetical protein
MIERIFTEKLDGTPNGATIDQHGAKDGLLDIHCLRRKAVQVASIWAT